MNNVIVIVCDLYGEKRFEICDIVSDKYRVNGIDFNFYQFEELLKINVIIIKYFEINIMEIQSMIFKYFMYMNVYLCLLIVYVCICNY